MQTEKKDLSTPHGLCDVFIARPAGKGPHPAVIFLMDAFGLRESLYTMAKNFASHGYFVLLPNLFYRERRSPVVNATFPLRAEDMPSVVPQIMPLAQSLTAEMVMGDMKVFFDFLSTQKDVSAQKIALTGYCMGGRFALHAAGFYPTRISAVASFHAGRLVTESADSTHHLFSKIQGEVYLAHADNDASMPSEQIEQVEQILENAGIKHKSEVYTGAAHGFTMSDLPAYHAQAFARHEKNLLDLFKRNLKNKVTLNKL